MKISHFPVSSEIKIYSINEISNVSSLPFKNDFVIIGAGKTGMDAINYLLRNQILA